MKPTVWYLGFLVCFSVVGAWAAPERSAPQQELAVVVVNAHADPAQPVQGVRVSLSFVSGSEKVVDARDATNRTGQALLLVSPEAAQRGSLRIEITGISGLVVYTPADGQLAGLPVNVTIQLLPKGSPALLGPAQIEAMLHRLSVQSNAKSQEIRALKGELAAAQGQRPDDLTVAMTAWATANGFTAEDADKQVHQWAEEIQRRKDQATAEQKALAELALKHYGVAAQLFNQAADDIGQSMDEDEKKFLEERRKQLIAFVDKKIQSSNTYQLNLQYHQATQILEQARVRAAAEHGRYPEDSALRSIWLATVIRLADARQAEGNLGKAGESAALLTQSIEDYQGLLREMSAPAERQVWARTQTKLGGALTLRGSKASVPQATELLAQAVQAFRAALEVQTKAEMPKDWAMTQACLGEALADQGERSSGTQATGLLAQAVEAYRAALEVRTRADFPQAWAGTQYGLGNALWVQGERSSGSQATELFAQAVQAYRAALEVFTKADQPHGWAMTYNSLGNALLSQGQRSRGTQAAELLAQAVEAFRAALEVHTRADVPQAWARQQANLGRALMNQGLKSSGAQATELLAQAVQAYRASLEVRTKADLPLEWAGTQSNLGLALTDQGERSSGAPAVDLFAQAVPAFRAALEVYTKADAPQAWALTQNHLGYALTDQGERSSGVQATELFAQAVQAYKSALEVFTRADTPQAWALAQINLGRALADQGDFTGASSRIEASLQASPDNVNLLSIAVFIYQEKFFDYTRSYTLMENWLKLDASAPARVEMLDMEFTTNRFEECVKQASAIDDASMPSPAAPMILIRDSIKLSCQWAAGQKTAAQETEKALLAKTAGLQKIGWGFAGPRHFLATAPAFEASRSSWIALFESLDQGDGAAMAGALQQLDDVMKH